MLNRASSLNDNRLRINRLFVRLSQQMLLIIPLNDRDTSINVDTIIFELNALNGSNGLAILGIDEDDRSGTSVGGAGDINGDGIDDLIIGARWAAPMTNAGESYVVFGSATDFTRNLELSSLDGNNGFAILELAMKMIFQALPSVMQVILTVWSR